MKSVKGARKKSAVEAPKLHKVSEELKQWAVLLTDEVATWPDVQLKPMFGLVSFYRNNKIFAALPRTRVLSPPHSIIFKFHSENAETRDARERLQEYRATGWLSFELLSKKDVGAALQWLELAYRAAR